MILNPFKHPFAFVGLLLASGVTAALVSAAPIKNIVLVHGAFVDGSGWQGVYEILVKDGYHVTLVQQPLTSLEDDVAAAKRILDARTARASWSARATAGR